MNKPKEPISTIKSSNFICNDANKKQLAILAVDEYIVTIGNELGGLIAGSGLFNSSEVGSIGTHFTTFSKEVKEVLKNKFRFEVGPILMDCLKRESESKKSRDTSMHS